MPITQERMIRLIEAGDYFRERLMSARAKAEVVALMSARAKTIEEAQAAVDTIYAELTHMPAGEMDQTINFIEEKKHFEINAKRNYRNRHKTRQLNWQKRYEQQMQLDEQELEEAGIKFPEPPKPRPDSTPKEFDYEGLKEKLISNWPKGKYLMAMDINAFALYFGLEDGKEVQNYSALLELCERLKADGVIERTEISEYSFRLKEQDA